jgi:hypothetical protein
VDDLLAEIPADKYIELQAYMLIKRGLPEEDDGLNPQDREMRRLLEAQLEAMKGNR